MARDKDTCKNFIAWCKVEFSFTANAATTLHDVQMLMRYLARAKGCNEGSSEKYKKGVGLKIMSLV